MNELTEVIKRRRSVRKFEPKPISEEIIRDILDCARLAPTANNLQPWLFGAVTNPSIRREIAELTEYGKFIKDCAVCFAVFADSTKKYFLEDGCAATENILLAAVGLGLGTVWLGVHSIHNFEKQISEHLQLPSQVKPLNVIYIGYPAEEKSARTQYRADRVHWGKYT